MTTTDETRDDAVTEYLVERTRRACVAKPSALCPVWCEMPHRDWSWDGDEGVQEHVLRLSSNVEISATYRLTIEGLVQQTEPCVQLLRDPCDLAPDEAEKISHELLVAAKIVRLATQPQG